MDNWFLTKAQRQCSGEEGVFSKNGAQSAEQPSENETWLLPQIE